MYPASQLGVGYGQDDLPNEIENGIDVFGNRGIWTKSGMKYLADFTNDDETYAAEITVDTDSLGNKGWVFRREGEAIVDILGECLFFSSELAATDLFADTYTVNTYDEFVGGSPVSSFTITRQSLCVWAGFDGRYGEAGTNVQLTYTTPNEGSPRTSMWTMASNGRVDDGPYNSPEGIYADGNYVWEVVP
jgi:hypothetical protein